MPTLISIIGPTAVGKTSVAVALANKLDAEIISADSRQVYTGMDIGTGKDIEEYTIAGKQIPYHLIDIVDAGYKYSVFEYQRDFNECYKDICQRGKQAILCGGTGLYIDAVINAYKMLEVPANYELRAELEKKTDEELTKILSSLKTPHNKTDFDTRKRAIRAIEIEIYQQNNEVKQAEFKTINNIYFGITVDLETRRQRIKTRLYERLENGMIDEVKTLLNSGIEPDNMIYYGLEYKFLTLHILGKLNYEEMCNQLNVAINQFAKRQMTWFRGMERKGEKIYWIDGVAPMDEKLKAIEEHLHNFKSK